MIDHIIDSRKVWRKGVPTLTWSAAETFYAVRLVPEWRGDFGEEVWEKQGSVFSQLNDIAEKTQSISGGKHV